jgi:peptidoglycan-associated lipoprotein
VENQLRSNGIDLANIRTVSYGEDKPAVAGSGESAWSQNRRAVLWVGKAAN